MNSQSTQKKEKNYSDKLKISKVTIGKAKNLIKEHIINSLESDHLASKEKCTIHLIGDAGIGKTAICYQIANELSEETGKKFDTIVVTCSILSKNDFIIPFPTVKEGINKFRMLYSDFLPTDPDSYGIFVIDEFWRGEYELQQLMWQIQNNYCIHQLQFPKGWFVISLDNPDDQDYSMTNVVSDAAGLRRMLHLYVETSLNDFMNYATLRKFHPYVIDFIKMNPSLLYDKESKKLGNVYSNPASYEKLSNILYSMEKEIQI